MMFGIVFGVAASYSEENGLVIYTAEYLIEYYNDKASKNGFVSINTEDTNDRTIAYDLLLVNKNNRFGITDLSFNEKVGTKYDTILFNEYGKEFIVSSSNKYGIIDERGNIKVNLFYDGISVINYSPLLYKIKNNNKYGIMNEEGTLITNIVYEKIGYTAETENKLENSTVIVPALNEEIKQSVVVKETSGYGLVDIETGKPIIECNLDKIYNVLEDGKEVYKGVYQGQEVDLLQYIKAVNTIVVPM